MQLTNLKIFILTVIKENNRLQKVDINNKIITNRKVTDTQVISFLISFAVVIGLTNGFNSSFAGYLISFLAIFIGLFTSINISLYEKKNTIFNNYNDKDQIDKVRLIKMKNYLTQFSGLVSYSILIAIIIIILLLFVLLNDNIIYNIHNYKFLKHFNQINIYSIFLFFKGAIILMYRYLVMYLLCTFFVNTLYAVTSYFSFLQIEYKNIKFKENHFE